MRELLFRNVELHGRDVVDVKTRAGRVVEIGRSLDAHRAGLIEGGVIEGGGGALLPGLHDHHLHLHAVAAAASSVVCGPPSVQTPAELAQALAHAPHKDSGWIRGVGYIESVAGELDAASLDRLHDERPVRVQHRSGAMWMLNTRAAQTVGLATATHPGIERHSDGTPTGRLWRADDWLRERLPDDGPPDLTPVGEQLLSLGITGVTDATPDLSPSSQQSIVEAVRTGALPQTVMLLGTSIDGPGLPAGSNRVTEGPYKIVLADSSPTDYDELASTISRVHSRGRPFAAHCISRENLLILLAVLDDVGSLPGDRIEHGGLIPRESIADLRQHGLTVVTQPGFLTARGDDFLAGVDERDRNDLYRCRSLTDASVGVAVSSDAPYGPVDPWANVRSAMERRTRTGAVVGGTETLTADEALRGYLAPPNDPGGPARAVHIGGPSDLVLLRVPRAEALRAPSAEHVRFTMTSSP